MENENVNSAQNNELVMVDELSSVTNLGNQEALGSPVTSVTNSATEDNADQEEKQALRKRLNKRRIEEKFERYKQEMQRDQIQTQRSPKPRGFGMKDETADQLRERQLTIKSRRRHFDTEDTHVMHRSRYFERTRERIIQLQRREEMNDWTGIPNINNPPPFECPDDWYLYEFITTSSDLVSKKFLQGSSHALMLRSRLLNRRVQFIKIHLLTKSKLENLITTQILSPSVEEIESSDLMTNPVAMRLRCLLFVTLNEDILLSCIGRLEANELQTDRDWTFYRTGRNLRKLWWHMTKDPDSLMEQHLEYLLQIFDDIEDILKECYRRQKANVQIRLLRILAEVHYTTEPLDISQDLSVGTSGKSIESPS